MRIGDFEREKQEKRLLVVDKRRLLNEYKNGVRIGVVVESTLVRLLAIRQLVLLSN